ncbi:hypothetical protein LOK46_14180 [Methylobacterium sp. NMS14P]|uniref:hypothetical protein n=1 Tax=unclassified Methylobacterium TaxID=2615210 RepID=UPI00235A35E9|nr:hypothetical protein [Methylobacterium sp. NMS14P]WCS27921.1 hypothetical protein LOK46_14180 [Methylobacterium sp. NMS14P]
MPFPIKFGLSVAVALAALAGWFYMGYLGQVGPRWAVAFLGPFMVFSLWIFPEVMRSRSDGRTPRHQMREVRS